MDTDTMEADILGDLDLYRFEGAGVATGGNSQANIIVMVISNSRSQESLVLGSWRSCTPNSQYRRYQLHYSAGAGGGGDAGQEPGCPRIAEYVNLAVAKALAGGNCSTTSLGFQCNGGEGYGGDGFGAGQGHHTVRRASRR